ncbi:LAMI_0H10374g1_1 [Lachancea mirantina]|uniref:LAMI_0H10374g1_1 n=1 Tax=Lachancea mirantina TaxID=1230905 RepID=A0A1G4KGS0_9SACH|nr:LAMI_0H10374g1_1 [Lachancea mirantina]
MERSSTPSLVGVSVRSINDSSNPDFSDNASVSVAESRTSPKLLNKIQSSTNLSKTDSAYTSVDDLTREGALLTDDNDVDLDQVINRPGEPRVSGELRRAARRPRAAVRAQYTSDVGLRRSQHSSTSLVTATDPLHDSRNSRSSSVPAAPGTAPNDKIRNSFGEFIPDKSHRPHLAHGDSYQNIHEGEEDEERAGRSSRREKPSTDYLRSLSRSLSRDARKTRAIEELKDARMYSTNNYSISRADLENAPHVIKEEREEEEQEGVLIDDEGNEEYPPELTEAKINAGHD